MRRLQVPGDGFESSFALVVTALDDAGNASVLNPAEMISGDARLQAQEGDQRKGRSGLPAFVWLRARCPGIAPVRMRQKPFSAKSLIEEIQRASTLCFFSSRSSSDSALAGEQVE
jgi:hypothetical protein